MILVRSASVECREQKPDWEELEERKSSPECAAHFRALTVSSRSEIGQVRK